MPSWKDSLMNRGLEMGMSVVQQALSHPTVGPLMMRSVNQVMTLKSNLEEAREQLLARMQIASFQEQEELRTNLVSMEKKIERLERRLREMHAKERQAKVEAAKARQAAQRAEADKLAAEADAAPTEAPTETPSTDPSST
jgi:TolA-binding protein